MLHTLKNDGYTFVVRDLGGAYSLGADEVKTLTDHGLYIVSAWAGTADARPISALYFTAASDKGTSDARQAIARAQALGQPAGTPIYFQVNYDAPDSDVRGCILTYLRAVKAVFEASHYLYKLGLYGSGVVLDYYKNTFQYTWLAANTAWRGYSANGGYSLVQGAVGSLGSGTGSIAINKDTSNGAAGGWNLNTAPTSAGTIFCGNSYLGDSQKAVNAQYIWEYLRTRGWTKNAVSGLLGNMETESTINPGIWQSLNANNTRGGFGLTQWTPATKYLNWARSQGLSATEINSQLQRILYEATDLSTNRQWWSTASYKITFEQFTHSTDSAYQLACAFLHCYERPANSNTDKIRGDRAAKWFNTLT